MPLINIRVEIEFFLLITPISKNYYQFSILMRINYTKKSFNYLKKLQRWDLLLYWKRYFEI